MWFDPFEALRAAAPAPTTAAPTIDPDSYCWPHSAAWNSTELALFQNRAALLRRDRDTDDRRCCWECKHLSTTKPARCNNRHRAGITQDGIPAVLLPMLQRCPGFAQEVLP